MTSRCLAVLAFTGFVCAQTPRPSDWLSAGGDAQQSGWEKNDSQFTKADVKNFTPVLHRKLGTGERLNAPIVIGRLITHKGFKELAVAVSQSGHVWAIDADLDLVFWERQLPGKSTATCGLVAMPAMMPAPETGPGRNALRPIFIVAADGRLYRLNPATGEDSEAPLDFLPAGSNASPLTVSGNMVQTSTQAECGAPKAHWAIDAARGKIAAQDLAMKEVTTTWEDVETHTRWKINTPAKTGVLSALKGDRAAPAWTAPGTFLPVAPVVANGVVFALSPTALCAFDATTGQKLYSTGAELEGSPDTKGLALANGRVYFVTRDGSLWAFGTPIER